MDSQTTSVELSFPVNSLISFHYMRDKDVSVMKSWGLNLIGDSGAFSAMTQQASIDLDEFAAWGTRWRQDLAWMASLDVIGDAEASWENFQALRSNGLDPVPTIHFGCDPRELDRYGELGIDFVGLGGMVALKGEHDKLLRWCVQVFKYARDTWPNMRFHGWGVTHWKLISSLPWYSVDSSGFSSSYRFARMSLFDPAHGRRIGYDMDGKQVFKHAKLIRDVYGIDPKDIAESLPGNYQVVVLASIKTVQLYEDHLRRRYKVKAPSYALNSEQLGPNIHAALGNHDPLYRTLKAQGPHIHVALGAPGMQPLRTFSPTHEPPPDARPNG